MASRNQINTNFWQIANASSDGDILGIAVNYANLGAVANVKIMGGNNGQFLQTDGLGNLTFANASGGNGTGSPGGANTQIQYNNNSSFGGIANLTYNNTTDSITYAMANVSLGNVSNLHITGGSNGQVLQTDGLGNLSFVSIGAATYSNANVANYLPTYTGNLSGSNLVITNNANVANLTANGIVNLGIVSNVRITGGVVNQVLTTDGSGGLSWTTIQTNANTSNISYATEQIQLISAPFTTYNFDVLSSAIKYATTGATTNLTINFRGNTVTTFSSICPLANSITATYVMTTGATPFSVTDVTIDGINQTIRWVGGAAPQPIANSFLSHTFTIIKTASTPTYTVLGSITRYA